MIDDERICPKTHDSSDVYLSSDETQGTVVRAQSVAQIASSPSNQHTKSAPSRIVYLVLMAASRITREQKRCRVHRAPGQLVSRSLVPRHRTQLETRYPRLVSRPIKQLGEERSGKIGLQRSRTLAEYRGNDPLRSAVPRVHVQVWTLYTQSVPR